MPNDSTLRLVDATTWKDSAADQRGAMLLAKSCDSDPVAVTKAPSGEAVERAIEWVVSTSRRDRDRDRLLPEGCDYKNFRKNPVVLWAHDSGRFGVPNPPIGRALSITVDRERGQLRMLKQFAPREIYPFAAMIYELALAKYLRTASVGFIPKAWEQDSLQDGEKDDGRGIGCVFGKWELLESSVVPIPSNPEALSEAKSIKGIDTSPYIAWAEQILDLNKSADSDLWIPRKSIEAVHAVVRPQRSTFVVEAKDAPPAPQPETAPVADPAPSVTETKAVEDEGIPVIVLERTAPEGVLDAPAVATKDAAPVEVSAPAIEAAPAPEATKDGGPEVSTSTKAPEDAQGMTAEQAREHIARAASFLFARPSLTPEQQVRIRAEIEVLEKACEHCMGDEDEDEEPETAPMGASAAPESTKTAPTETPAITITPLPNDAQRDGEPITESYRLDPEVLRAAFATTFGRPS